MTTPARRQGMVGRQKMKRITVVTVLPPSKGWTLNGNELAWEGTPAQYRKVFGDDLDSPELDDLDPEILDCEED